ncbi:hypothetical protein SUDANB13_00083 [Streptomyces sp. enrichment culture]
MMVVGIVAVCVVIAVLAFFVPRLSRHPQNGTQRTLGFGSRAGSKAPGPLGRLLSKPFNSSSRAVGRSGSAGRRARQDAVLSPRDRRGHDVRGGTAVAYRGRPAGR